jgi:hypothetical protein
MINLKQCATTTNRQARANTMPKTTTSPTTTANNAPVVQAHGAVLGAHREPVPRAHARVDRKAHVVRHVVLAQV